MMELRIPRRLVLEFSDIVYKKTSGHTIFVVQLLNSLVCNSMIAYSPQKRRFHWNLDKILLLKTCDSVADLIVSNLSYLQPEALQALRILSCFGIKSHLSLLDLLETFPSRPRGGVISYLPSLFEEGILEEAGTIITFAHDLIQQQV